MSKVLRNTLAASFTALGLAALGDYYYEPNPVNPNDVNYNNTDVSGYNLQLSDMSFQACVLEGVRETLPNAEASYYSTYQRWRNYGEYGPHFVVRDRSLSEIHTVSMSYAIDWDAELEARIQGKSPEDDLLLTDNANVSVTSRVSNFVAIPHMMRNFRRVLNSGDRFYSYGEDGNTRQYVGTRVIPQEGSRVAEIQEQIHAAATAYLPSPD